ncbi:dTDP-4-dehydrorhamnose reductase [bacterium BMS3Abin07]|nr:dTDP-4-dehydrorhamnose reductase [bacterium BMS3Abin07]GBE32647.1 dTDP-4-dehydrorhamnose reductase [bacterium BMS3Bbin05]HDZ87386.1 dTDP-4-dehydrorhamnose reductase [Nitrospirota bacterium]
MKILVTGSSGMLGSDLHVSLGNKHQVLPYSGKDLDLTLRAGTISAVRAAQPDIVINCAAYTKVDLAEKEREKAFLVNGVGVQNLAIACEELKIPLCHISTDYVFDGASNTPYTPFDDTGPINVYGESKLAGEKYIQWIMNKFYIVRTSWLYGKSRNNFVYTIQKLCANRDEIRIVDDQTGSPTWTVSLSQAIGQLIETGAYGIYHITDDTGGGISWYDFACEIVSVLGSGTRVIPIKTEEYPTPAKRPRHSILDISLNYPVFGYKAPGWKQSLQKFFSSD